MNKLINKLMCFFGMHDWVVTHREYRDSERRGAIVGDTGSTIYMSGVVKQEECSKCNKNRYYQFGEYIYN